jgi:glycosyltransferase involved in cell wall biosynthesis
MTRVLTDDALRAQLRKAGFQRAQDFSWAASAQIVLDALRVHARER